MKKSLFKIILAALCLLLPSCQEEEGLFSTSVYDMVLDGDCPGFDHPEIDTRAYGSTWENNDKLYIRFSNGGTTRIGEATYSSSSRKWTIDAGGALSETSSGSCRVYYLRGGSVSRSGSSVTMDEHTAIFADEYASYTYSSGVVTVSAALAPQTWRLCFKGQMGTSVTLSSNSNVKYASALNLSSGSYTTQSKKVTESVQSDGYTRFLYGTFQSNSVELEYQVNGKSYYKSVGKSRLGIGKSGYISLPMGGTLDLGLIKTFNHTISAGNSSFPSSFNAAVSESNFSAVDSYLSWDEFLNHYQLDADAYGYGYQFTSSYSPVSSSAILGHVSALEYNGSLVLTWELSAEEKQKIYTYYGGSASVIVRFLPADGANSDYQVYMSIKLNVDKQTPSYGTIGDKNVNYWYPVDYYSMTCSNVWQSGAYDALRANVHQPVENSDSKTFSHFLQSGWDGNAIQFKNGARSPATYNTPYEYFYFHPANNNIVVSDPNSSTRYYLSVESTAISGSFAPSNVTIGSTASATIDNLRSLESNYYLTPGSGTVYQNTKIYISTRSGGKDEVLCTLDKVTGMVEYSWSPLDNSLVKQYLNLFDYKTSGSYIYVGVYGEQYSNPGYICPLTDNVYPVYLVKPITAMANQTKEVLIINGNGTYISVLDLVENITDWRDVNFIPNNIWYFAYYNIKSVTVDLENVTSNIDNPSIFTKLTDKTNDIVLMHLDDNDIASAYVFSNMNKNSSDDYALPITYGAGWVESANQSSLMAQLVKKFGYIYFDNNRGREEDFDLLIPVQLTYDWGTLPTVYAKIHVICEQSSSGGNSYDNGHEYVDLGLPSGLKWATCNVGANSPEDYGDYFAWGETEPKSYYDWSSYFDTIDGGTTFQKYYCNGGYTVLRPEDDAAHVNWGGSWRMPTEVEQDELRNECTWEWTTLNGINGRKVTGPNGNSIFLPAAGFLLYYDTHYEGSYGYYWSSNLYQDGYDDKSCRLLFNSGDVGWGVEGNRDYGQSVRPVR